MTDNTNLPRLDNSASNRNTAFGGLQIFLGISSLCVSLVFLILRILIFKGTSYNLITAVIWVFIVLGVWALSIGTNRMTVNSTFRRLQNYLNGGDFTIEKLSELTGHTPNKLLNDISLMHYRKYWRRVTVLEDAVVIEPVSRTNRVHKIFSSEGMRFVTKKQGEALPHILILAVLFAIVRIVPIPLPNWMLIIAAIVVSVPLKKLSANFTPKKLTIFYDEIPQYVPDKINLELSGNEQADILISQGQKHLEELAQLEISIKDEHLNKRIKEISAGTKQMLEKLKDSPEKFTQVRQTMNYSLPTAIELFHKYRELDSQPIKGDNIKRSMDRIHDMSDLVSATFEKELNALYQDQTLDIEVDIEVMKNMLQEESMDFPSLAENLTKDIDNQFPNN